MSGLKNTVKRVAGVVTGQGYKTNRERRQEKSAKKQAKLDEVYAAAQIPDDEEIRRNERRKAAKRQGSRASTILTNRDSLG